jgi:hypothetical protein
MENAKLKNKKALMRDNREDSVPGHQKGPTNKSNRAAQENTSADFSKSDALFRNI